MEIFAIINGKSMTKKEFMVYKAAKCGKVTKAVKTDNNAFSTRDMIKGAAGEVEELYKQVKVITSLIAFYENGHRQWGKNFDFVVSIKGIHRPLSLLIIRAREAVKIMDEIKVTSRRGSRSVFQLIELLSYKMDDIREYLGELCKAVDKTAVLGLSQNCPCISDRGRRLGLAILISRSELALPKFDEIIKKLNKIQSY